MSTSSTHYDVIVIGAGYYGCRMALRLQEVGFGRILLVDLASSLLTRASFANQARVHGGYHYPRALDTAATSRRYFDRFLSDHSEAIVWDVESLYAIARSSKVSPRQFERACHEIGAPIKPVPARISRLLDANLLEAAYIVDEFAFDSKIIARQLLVAIDRSALELRLGTRAKILGGASPAIELDLEGNRVTARFVLNATYAGLDGVGVRLRSRLRKEMAEILLIRPPGDLNGLAVTVMDGPFFSTLPFPALGAYSLTHVRFTPVVAWENGGDPPPNVVPGLASATNGAAMIQDASRYIPCLAKSRVLGSIYDVKVVLLSREVDDGRPILFEEAPDNPGVISILGSKVDNIYDAMTALEERLGIV